MTVSLLSFSDALGHNGRLRRISGSVGGRVIGGIAEPFGEPPIPFDHDNLGQFGDVVAVAGESNPTSDVAVVQDVVLDDVGIVDASGGSGTAGGGSACCRAASLNNS